MKSILVFVDPVSPSKKSCEIAEMQDLIKKLAPITKKISGIEKPLENVWLIPLPGGWPLLVELLYEMRHHQMAFRTILLDESPILVEKVVF